MTLPSNPASARHRDPPKPDADAELDPATDDHLEDRLASSFT